MDYISTGENNTKDIAYNFCKELENLEGPVLVLMYGDLGTGKTTFIKGVAKFFEIKEEIVSPTFLIQKTYKINKKCNFKNLIHIDAYRIEELRELQTIRWDNYSKDKENLIFIEWPEKMQTDIKSNFVVNINHLDEEKRQIKIIKNA